MNSNLEISFLSLLAYAALYLFGFLIFVIIFLLGSKLAESVSGLTELALKYRENGTMIGQTFSFQSAGFGDPWFPTSYSNCLTFVISTNGFLSSQCGFFGIYSRVSLFRGQQLRLLRRGLIGVYQVFD